MKPVQEPVSCSPIRKLEPQALMPEPETLNTLSHADRLTLERRLSTPIECIFDDVFQEADAEMRLFGGEMAPRRGRSRGNPNDDSGADLLAKDEAFHFRRLNYCRHRVMRVLREFRGRPLTPEATKELIEWENRTAAVRSEIVQANVPLVLAMAKRTKISGVDHADLISEGNLALLRSVDKFDHARGFKFSTYACRAILKSFSRVASRTARYRGYFPTEFDPTLEKSDHSELRRQDVEASCVDELKSILGQNLAALNEVEAAVIKARFSIQEPSGSTEAKARTLEQVGEMIGVTKERVRQIQNKALSKLRTMLEEGVLST